MNDRTLSATSTCAYLSWIVGLIFIAAGFFDHRPWGTLGMAIVCSGCVCQIRGFFIAADDRERRAFELGREVGGGEVRTLHVPR